MIGRSHYGLGLIQFGKKELPENLRYTFLNYLNYRCTAIFSGMPRVIADGDEFTLSVSKERLKELIKQYFGNYTKQEAERIRALYVQRCEKSIGDYSLSDSNALLLKKFKPVGSCKRKKKAIKPASFIPLTPSELYNIKVDPTHINLESVC